mgnify:CR=1 FL=1
MFIRALRAELIKGKHAPVWIAFIVLPLIPACLGTFNYLGNLELLTSSWYSLWTQHTLFAAFFFLPALLAVYCAWEWRLENTDHNFNSFLTAPVPTVALYLAKLLPAVGVSVLTQLVVGLLFIASGFLAGIREPLPPQLLEWLGCGALGSIAICAVQLFLSLVIRSFAIPVAIGLLGGIAGLMATAQGWGLYFPYSLLAVGMRANNPNMTIDIGQLALATLIVTLVCAVLTVGMLAQRDVAAE